MTCKSCGGALLGLLVEIGADGQSWAEYKGHSVVAPRLYEIGIETNKETAVELSFCTKCGKVDLDFPITKDKLSSLFDGPYWCDQCEKETPFPDSVRYCEMCAKELCDECADWRGAYVYERVCSKCWNQYQDSWKNECD